MARKITKAAGNVYCQARLKAAEYNERFATRAGASDLIPGVTEDSIKKYELGITNPPCEVVVLMADAYNAPELKKWYCANQCPAGKDCREIPDMPIERMIIRIQNAADDLDEAAENFAQIVDDGVIDDEELSVIKKLRTQFLETKQRLDEIIAECDKILKDVKRWE